MKHLYSQRGWQEWFEAPPHHKVKLRFRYVYKHYYCETMNNGSISDYNGHSKDVHLHELMTKSHCFSETSPTIVHFSPKCQFDNPFSTINILSTCCYECNLWGKNQLATYPLKLVTLWVTKMTTVGPHYGSQNDYSGTSNNRHCE